MNTIWFDYCFNSTSCSSVDSRRSVYAKCGRLGANCATPITLCQYISNFQ